VLRFTNMSGDPAQEYFSDGTRRYHLGVVASAMVFVIVVITFAYKKAKLGGEAELGENSAFITFLRKRAQERTRMRIPLPADRRGFGSHIWVERYDRELSDILRSRTNNRQHHSYNWTELVGEATRAEKRPIEDLNAWDLVARALWHFWKLSSEEARRPSISA